MKRAAVIGLGDISFCHVPVLQSLPEVTLCAVCDEDPAAAMRAPQGVPFYTDYRAMLAEARPDCVHICLPHYLHYPVSAECVARGVHVFCEKPVAMDTAQALEFAALEAAHPEIHMGICLQNRRNNTTVRLKQLIDSGEYGRVLGCSGYVPWFRPKSYYEAKPWRGRLATAGGGCMINQSVHTLDLLYHLCGPVAELHASVAQLLDYGIEVEDTVTAHLRFENGASGVFWATNANYRNANVQLTVQLEKATFEMRDYTLYELREDGPVCLCEDDRLPGVKYYYGASHQKLIAEFYRALETGDDDYIHVRDAVMSMRLIDAILASAKTGAAVRVGPG